jgi:hypothetical protein
VEKLLMKASFQIAVTGLGREPPEETKSVDRIPGKENRPKGKGF